MVCEQEICPRKPTGSTGNDEGVPSLSPLAMRVVAPGSDGGIVRFDDAKSTVGSDATCTYRIRDHRIQPVECLILRGPGGSIVRRWGNCTRLNGRTFSDARLEAGDRLSIGSVEFEVIENHAAPVSSDSTMARTGQAQPTDNERADDERASGRTDERTIEFEAMKNFWQSLCDELHCQIAAVREERQVWEDQRERWESELAGCRTLLRDLQTQFDEFQQARQQEQESWLAQVEQLQTLLEAATRAKDEPSATEGGRVGQALEDRAYPSDEGFLQGENQPAHAERFLYHEQQGIAATRFEEEPNSEFPWPSTDSPDTPRMDEQGVRCDAHGDAAEVDEHHVAEEAREEAPTNDPPSWLQQYQEQQDDVDDSITDYMSRLLQRVGGRDQTRPSGRGEVAAASAPLPEDPPERDEGPRSGSTESPREPPEASAQPEVPDSPTRKLEEQAQFAPRNAAPERDTNMAAMRELANVSARSAIRTCDKNRSAKGALRRIPLLLVEAGIGGLLWYWATISNQAIAYAGATIAFAAAALTGTRTLGLLLKTALAALSVPQLQDTAVRPAEDAEP